LLMLCSRCSENKRNFSSYFTTTLIRLREEFTHPCIQALIRFAMHKFYCVCVCVYVCVCGCGCGCGCVWVWVWVCARAHILMWAKRFVYRGKQVRAHRMIGEYCNSRPVGSNFRCVHESSISPIAATPAAPIPMALNS